MAQPTAVLQPANRAAGMGVFYTVYYVMMTALPAVAGWLRDMVGPRAPLIFAAGLMLASLGAQIALWWRPQARPTALPEGAPAP